MTLRVQTSSAEQVENLWADRRASPKGRLLLHIVWRGLTLQFLHAAGQSRLLTDRQVCRPAWPLLLLRFCGGVIGSIACTCPHHKPSLMRAYAGVPGHDMDQLVLGMHLLLAGLSNCAANISQQSRAFMISLCGLS